MNFREKNATGCADPASNVCVNTAAIAKFDASHSIVYCFEGSAKCNIGADVNFYFNSANASFCVRPHTNAAVFFSRFVIGKAIFEKSLMNLR